MLDVWGELELARDTLAQVQALHMEVAERNRTYSDNVTEACSRKSLCTEVEACASPGTSRHAPSISKAVASLSMAKQDKREVLSVSISPPQSNTQSVVKKTRKTVKRYVGSINYNMTTIRTCTLYLQTLPSSLQIQSKSRYHSFASSNTSAICSPWGSSQCLQGTCCAHW